MKLVIDSADLAGIRRLYHTFPVVGVTTNPSILARTGRPPYETLREIRRFIGKDELHVQVVGRDCNTMLAEAESICSELGADTYIKVPVTTEGIKAILRLKKEGYRVTATCIYTQLQGYLAGEAGADRAAPYVNRIDNLGADGAQTAIDIHEIYRSNGLFTQVLAASFKNCRQVLRLVSHGIGAATLSVELFDQLLRLDAVDAAVAAFQKDLNTIAGSGGCMILKE